MGRPVTVYRRRAADFPAPTPLATPCRIWQGALHTSGYGLRRHIDPGPRFAHRWVWTVAYGPIPPGMQVCHRCDNPPCFRLDHLFLGTNADNVADMVAKGRNGGGGGRPRRATCRQGGHPIAEKDGHRWCPTCAVIARQARRRRRQP